MHASTYSVWRMLRRPFRYPACERCVWDVFACSEAGCLKCGQHHVCLLNSVDCRCPLALSDDSSRVCTITGMVVNEVRYGKDEWLDTCAMDMDHPKIIPDIDGDVQSVVFRLLLGEQAKRHRDDENGRMIKKICLSLNKTVKQFKINSGGMLPVLPTCLAYVVHGEKNVRLLSKASEELANKCCVEIVSCLLDLRKRGMRIIPGPSLQEMACGLLYLLRSGLYYNQHVLLPQVEEIESCLPAENKLQPWFGISSKIITLTENHVKLHYREALQ